MGCDIHWYSETRNPLTKKWECDQAESFTEVRDDLEYAFYDMNNFPGRHRDYWWFGFLQPGVRTEWDFGLPPTELPEDMSTEVSAIVVRWDSDVHSGGSHTRAALKAHREVLARICVEELIRPTEDVEAVKHLLQRLDETIAHLGDSVPDEDHRIIFFFDN